MKEIVEKSKCCGCHACLNICPQNAITMEEDTKGFKYPVINQEKCINCGMCKKVCPITNNNENDNKLKAYAAYNKNIKDRINSSSGGLFILFAKEILKRKGVVFGATFTDDFEVRHSYVEDIKDIHLLMGSKYSQSVISNTYKQAKKFLKEGRYVLFTGTPCQISGLKSFLRKDYDKLYTTDIICHGVPSPKLWKKYLDYLEKKYKEKVRSVSFRNKDHGWALFRMKISFDTKTYEEERKNDLFMQSFLRNICLRDSCYNCSFKKIHKESDITLGDYWGISDIHPELNDDKGVSLVFINSKKGEEFFNCIKNDLIFKETDVELAIRNNSAMVKSVNHCINEKLFIKNIDKLDLEKLVNRYVPYFPTAPFSRKIINRIKMKFNK